MSPSIGLNGTRVFKNTIMGFNDPKKNKKNNNYILMKYWGFLRPLDGTKYQLQ